MKKTIILYLKYIWLFTVIIFVSHFLYRRFPLILETFAIIPKLNIALSILSLFLAKFFLVVFMRCSLLTINKKLSLKECYNIYHTSQIAKYIPGSIWHFLSRGFSYKRNGFSISEIKSALILENLFLVGSAFLFGSGILIFKNYAFFFQLLLHYHFWFILAGIILIIGAVFTCYMLIKNTSDVLKKININNSIRIIFFLCGIWLSLGYGFYVLVEPFLKESVTVIELIGFFSLAFGIGYITPFAPAGIGVRESVLVYCLASAINNDTMIIITVFSRVIYLIVEIFLALSALIIREKTLQ